MWQWFLRIYLYFWCFWETQLYLNKHWLSHAQQRTLSVIDWFCLSAFACVPVSRRNSSIQHNCSLIQSIFPFRSLFYAPNFLINKISGKKKSTLESIFLCEDRSFRYNISIESIDTLASIRPSLSSTVCTRDNNDILGNCVLPILPFSILTC